MEAGAELLAAFDAATGEFVDLVLSDSAGLSFRTEAEDWQPYQPSDLSLDGREVVEVDESFVAVVDKAYAARTKPDRAAAKGHERHDGKAAGQ